MQTFIDQLIENIKLKQYEDYNKIQVVFPTRRACMIFKNRFVQHFSAPQWLPNIVSIEDFILSHCNFKLADDLTLLIELYQVYVKYYPKMNVDDFYQWGKILLNDFDETDSNLVDQQKLYATIKDLADVAAAFAPDDEELKFLERFWKSIFSSPPTDLRKNFIENWNLLPQVLSDFKKVLLENNIVYRGLAYRTVAEQFSTNKFETRYAKIVFASFYALSKSEETIIKKLMEQGIAELYWDADTYYTNDYVQEAGTYLRKNNLIKKEDKEVNTKLSALNAGNYFSSIKKDIVISGVPLRIGQAKYLGQLLQELYEKNELNLQSTVVVLPDEQLLFPVLYALPHCITEVNITMGFPAKNTAIFSLVNSFLLLLKHKRVAKKVAFSRIEFVDFISHPFIKSYILKKHSTFYTEWNELQLTTVPMSLLVTKFPNELFKLLNTHCETCTDLYALTIKFLQLFYDEHNNKTALSKIEKETLKYFIETIKNNEVLVLAQATLLSLQNGFTILRDLIKTIRIPFTGEPIKGIQIMGFLETRVLDFERVIILSVNEDFLPASKSSKTYIPYSLRRAFGLPTDENQDAIYAYHFYRLLQRASNVHLVYNTEVKSSGGGEPSRYLLQLELELKKKLKNNVTVTRQKISTDVITHDEKVIIIKKDKTILETLHNKFLNVTENQSAFSASSLQTYINCTLQFYFKYVANIKEKENFEENIDAAHFGTIIHTAMQSLYKEDFDYDKPAITALLKKINEAVQHAFKKELHDTVIEGRNLLTKTIITELVNKIVRNDSNDAPFKIIGLEKEYKAALALSNDQTFIVKGFIDRLDFKNDALRVLDYKSGKIDFPGVKNNSVETLFADSKYKAIFQLYLYALIISKANPNKSITAAFYHLKELKDGMKYINQGTIFTKELLDEFEKKLQDLVGNIFNPDNDFTQTTDVKKCAYCAFATICNR
jgi:hypothetical protein